MGLSVARTVVIDGPPRRPLCVISKGKNAIVSRVQNAGDVSDISLKTVRWTLDKTFFARSVLRVL